MTTCHLVTNLNLALLGDIDADDHVCSRGKLIALFTSKHAHVNNATLFTVRHTQGVITNITSLFTENCSQEFFFRWLIGFTFRRDLTNKDFTRTDPSTNANNALFIKVTQRIFTDVRNFTGDFFGTEFGLSCFNFVFFNVNRSVHIVNYEPLINQNCVFVVQAFPRHIGDQNVLTKGNFTTFSCRTISQHLS